MIGRKILFFVRQSVWEFPDGLPLLHLDCCVPSGREPQNVLTYTWAEGKIITERLSAYTEDPDSVF